VQTTVKSDVSFSGAGLHSGRPAHLTIRPASARYGVWFRRTDILVGDAMIPARWDAVRQSPLCTTIVNGSGASVSTVEHIMAALAGCGVHNALIDIDGPEVPILDGSAARFVRGILDKGVRELAVPVTAIEILQPVETRTDSGWARLAPHDGLLIDFHIDFDDAAIGVQDKSLNMANGSFVRELSNCRTFCRRADIGTMHANGLALGGSLDNAVVVDGDRVLTPGGLRHGDEAVRHKMLDAMGDLALAGVAILGHYRGYLAGHALTNALLRAVFSDPANYVITRCDRDTAAGLPGAGLHHRGLPQAA